MPTEECWGKDWRGELGKDCGGSWMLRSLGVGPESQLQSLALGLACCEGSADAFLSEKGFSFQEERVWGHFLGCHLGYPSLGLGPTLPLSLASCGYQSDLPKI